MEDLDLCVVASLLREGKPALKKARERGLRPDLLQGKGKDVYQFLVEYHLRFDELPPLEIIQGKTGISIPEISSALRAEFVVDEVFNRKTFEFALKSHRNIEELLTSTPPKVREVVEAFETTVLELRREQLIQSKVESLFSLGPLVKEHYDKIKGGARGILTPWPAINDITLGFWPMDLVLFVARLGAGKCVDADTAITDPITGIPRSIRQVVEGNQRLVHTWSPELGIHSVPITAKVDTGRKECLKVTFSSGRSVVVTPEHPFLSPEGWLRADKVEVGGTLALPARIPFPINPVSLPAEEVDLLALLLTEGSYTGHHVGFSTGDSVCLDIAKEAAAKIGTVVKHQKKYDYDFIPSTPVDKILNKHGIHKKKAIVKTIPDAVFQLPAELLGRFLGMVWMCDGYVDNSGPGITLASRDMVYQLQSLLLRFGVQSRVAYKKATCSGKIFDAWRLTVYSHAWNAFFENIPLRAHKAAALDKLLARDRNPNVGFPRVSDNFRFRIKQIAVSKRGGLLEVGRDLGWDSYFMVKSLFGKRNSLLLSRFETFCKVFECREEFKCVLNKDIFWDVVADIESVGERKIYDLTVSPTSCFVANDVIVHNTWTSVQLALCAWQQKKRVLFASTEISRLRIGIRLFALMGKLNYKEFTHGKLTIFSEPKFYQMVEEFLHEEGLYVVGGNFDFRVEALSAAIDEIRPDFVVLDGAYLLRTSGSTRTEQAANAFNELKRLSIRHEIPVATTHQFNREVKTNIASSVRAESIGLTDVAGWNADLIVGLVQTDDMKRDKKMRLKPLKAREGAGEEVEINWDLDTMDFRELGIETSNGSRGGGDADEFETGVKIDSGSNSDIPF